MPESKNEVVHFRVDKELKQEFELVAKELDRTASDLHRILMRQAINFLLVRKAAEQPAKTTPQPAPVPLRTEATIT